MGAKSAGLLVYRIAPGGVVEVLLAHPGGPYWARKDEGSWTVPKGEYEEGEDPLVAAFREFGEETGLELPRRDLLSLGELRQPSGKRVMVWALESDLDVSLASSNTFELEWPRGSGQLREFPEVDRLEWVPIALARKRLLRGQVPFLDRLEAVGVGGATEGTATSSAD
jgi:predicted NUDIX family NTP pyrophosphohydrolase